MANFLLGGLFSLVLVLFCAMVFYEILARIWIVLPRFHGRPRTQILLTIASVFLGHTICVWIFGASYYVVDMVFHGGTLKGTVLTEGFFSYLYFSCVSYSSLGLGDIYPTGILQMLMGVEGVLGLMLIGWSVTFTYIVTQQYLMHRGGKDHPLNRK